MGKASPEASGSSQTSGTLDGAEMATSDDWVLVPPRPRYSNSIFLNFLASLPRSGCWFDLIIARLLAAEPLAEALGEQAIIEEAKVFSSLVQGVRNRRKYDATNIPPLAYTIFDALDERANENPLSVDPRVLSLRWVLLDVLLPYFTFLPDEALKELAGTRQLSSFEQQLLNYLQLVSPKAQACERVRWSRDDHQMLMSVLRDFCLSPAFRKIVENYSNALVEIKRSGGGSSPLFRAKAAFRAVRRAKAQNLFDDTVFCHELAKLKEESRESGGRADRGNVCRAFFRKPADGVRINSLLARDFSSMQEAQYRDEQSQYSVAIAALKASLDEASSALNDYLAEQNKPFEPRQKVDHLRKRYMAAFGLYANLEELFLLSREGLSALMENMAPLGEASLELDYLNKVFEWHLIINKACLSPDTDVRRIVLEHCVYSPGDLLLRRTLARLCSGPQQVGLVLSLGTEFMSLQAAFQCMLAKKFEAQPYTSCADESIWPTHYHLEIEAGIVSIKSSALYSPAPVNDDSASCPSYLVETEVAAVCVEDPDVYTPTDNELWLDRSRGFLGRFECAKSFDLPADMGLVVERNLPPASPMTSRRSLSRSGSSESDAAGSGPSSPASSSLSSFPSTP